MQLDIQSVGFSGANSNIFCVGHGPFEFDAAASRISTTARPAGVHAPPAPAPPYYTQMFIVPSSVAGGLLANRGAGAIGTHQDASAAGYLVDQAELVDSFTDELWLADWHSVFNPQTPYILPRSQIMVVMCYPHPNSAASLPLIGLVSRLEYMPV